MNSLFIRFRFLSVRLLFALLPILFLAPAYAHAATTPDVWWPTEGAHVSGTQPFKGLVSGRTVSDYSMFWSVDNGQENSMYDSYQDYPHKEAAVNLSGWNWHGSGPYAIALIAREKNGVEIGRKVVHIWIDGAQTTTVAPTTTTNPLPIVTKTATAPGGSAPLTTSVTTTVSPPISTGGGLYVDPNSNAEKQALTWASSRPADAAIMQKMAAVPSASWFGGWNANVQADSAALVSKAVAAGKTALLVAYNIPGRDCGSYSAGGANGSDAYRAWIRSLASGIGNGKAIVILEPDATAGIDCLSLQGRTDRYALLSDAISVLKSHANTKVYLDGGNAHWIAAADMASRLTQAGVAKADGFSLNVSNFFTTDETNSYGKDVSSRIGSKPFVVDTSRNGAGSNGEWCNPTGRALGQAPTFLTGVAQAAAYLWLKTPGESDGSCNGYPSAGTWMPEYALGLAKKAGY